MSLPLKVITRLLVVNYVVTFLLLLIMNVPMAGGALAQAQETHPFLREVFAWMGSAAAVTFFGLFSFCIYHWGTHSSKGFKKKAWLFVILGLNFVGIVVYYILVIEREGWLDPEGTPPKDVSRLAHEE